MSGQRPIPGLDSPEARVLPADLLAEADCLRQLARLQPGGCFRLPYLYRRSGERLPYVYRGARGYITAICEARLLQFRDVAAGIYYHDFLLRAEDSLRSGEESARRYLPPGMERLLQSDYVLGALDPQEVYPLVVRHLLDSGFLDRYPDLRERAEAALTLGGLL